MKNKQQHIYQDIEGFFNFEKLYSEIAEWIPDGGRWVEVGVYKGRSFSYGIVEALNQGKNIDFVAVDGFPQGWEQVLRSGEKVMGLYRAFMECMEPLQKHFWTISGESSAMAARIEDGTVDFCFIDANHTRPSIDNDIKAWLPKMKPGGIIAGHDYNEPWTGVIEAVNEAFGDRVEHVTESNCWLVRL